MRASCLNECKYECENEEVKGIGESWKALSSNESEECNDGPQSVIQDRMNPMERLQEGCSSS